MTVLLFGLVWVRRFGFLLMCLVCGLVIVLYILFGYCVDVDFGFGRFCIGCCFGRCFVLVVCFDRCCLLFWICLLGGWLFVVVDVLRLLFYGLFSDLFCLLVCVV